MRRYLRYLQFVIKHKWHVSIECFKQGLIWQGITHDLSKFSFDEFIPYAKHFYNSDGSGKEIRDRTGYYKPTKTGDKNFDIAWLYHSKRNRHHWQYWCNPEEKKGIICYEIPEKYVKEMICDWMGARKSQKVTAPVIEWWNKNNKKMQLHLNTRNLIEKFLGV